MEDVGKQYTMDSYLFSLISFRHTFTCLVIVSLILCEQLWKSS